MGFHDWQIIEASARVGGRVHTSYLNGTRPDQYQYQEYESRLSMKSPHFNTDASFRMGPMRFPVSLTDAKTNETIEINDHKMVFQLADAINNLNGNDSSLMVNFIKWVTNYPSTKS